MIYLGVDASYSGFGLSAYDGVSGEHETFVKAFGGTGVDRLVRVEMWLRESLATFARQPIEHVAMEGYSAGSKFGREKAGELGAVVKLTLRDSLFGLSGYPTLVTPSSLKKFVLGKGVGGKNEMLLGVYKKWGVEFSDDNAADAYSLARLAHAVSNNIAPLRYEQEVLAKLHPHTEAPRADA